LDFDKVGSVLFYVAANVPLDDKHPLVEAFYHMKSIPDSDYNDYVATLNELESGTYII
jgi:hypothetical protein